MSFRAPSRVERLSENLAIFDFVLSEAEMAEIAGLARRDGRIVDYAYSDRQLGLMAGLE